MANDDKRTTKKGTGIKKGSKRDIFKIKDCLIIKF